MNAPTKMTNFRWGLFIGIAALLDLVQGLLSLLAIGLLINRILNPVIAASWYLLFWFHGIRYTKGGELKKGRIASMAIIFIIEECGLGDFLPGWTAQVANTLINEKADALAAKMSSASSVLANTKNTLSKRFAVRFYGSPTQQVQSTATKKGEQKEVTPVTDDMDFANDSIPTPAF